MSQHNATRHSAAFVGVACTLVGASLWGVSGTCMQFLTTTGGLSPALVTLMRALAGGAFLLALVAVRSREKLQGLLSGKKNLLALALFAVALYANQFCYAKTIQLTNAGTATVLQMLGTVFVMVYVCLVGRKAPRPREATGLVIALAATVLIATQGDPTSLHMPLDGLGWGVATGIAAAAYILVPKQTGLFEQYGSLPTLAVGMLLSAVVALPSYLLQGGSFPSLALSLAAMDATAWLVFLVGLAAVGTAGAFGLYLYGVSVVGPVAGSLLGAIEPVSATVMATAFLGTAFTGFDIAGMILMCLMVAFVSGDGPKRSARP